MSPSFTGTSAVGRAYIWAQNIWKGSVTAPWPAFHGRNYIGSQIQNMLAGLLRPARLLAENKNAHLLVTGREIAEAHKIPAVAAELRRRGLPESEATNVLREMATADRVWEPRGHAQMEVLGTGGGQAESVERLLGRVPGGLRGSDPLFEPGVTAPFRDFARKMGGIGSGPDKPTWNPLTAEVRGGMTGAERSTFAPFAAGEKMGGWIEGQNRLPAYMDMLRRGVSRDEAARRVAAAQVDYAMREFTPFEQRLKMLFPFYSYTSRMAKFVAGEVMNRPGGPLARVIRTSGQMTGGDEIVPAHVTQSMSVPMGELETGDRRYLTGMGLMHEDSFKFLGGGVQGGLLEAASRLNPLVGAPLEWATGQTFFQRGPDGGGRPLEELDPTIGRLMSNVAGLDQPVQTPQSLEFLAGASPLSRLLTTARTATDPRKRQDAASVGLLGMQMGTGMRITDVSPAQQDRLLRDQAVGLMKDLGARGFNRTYFPKDDLQQMPPEQQLQAMQLMQLQKTLAQRARERAASL